MSFLIKIFGAVATLLFALMLLRGYKYFLKKRKEERDEFLVLFDAVRDGVGCFLSPLSSIFSRFCEGDSTLARISRRIKDGESPKSAYNAEERGFHIGEAGREILSSFFSSLGRGYKDGEVAMCQSVGKRFFEYSESADKEDEKSARLAGALTVGAALGIIILFI